MRPENPISVSPTDNSGILTGTAMEYGTELIGHILSEHPGGHL